MRRRFAGDAVSEDGQRYGKRLKSAASVQIKRDKMVAQRTLVPEEQVLQLG
jgi:hypothetical protein